MQDLMRPLLHKAPVTDLRVNVSRSALCIGDAAELHLLAGGEVGIFAFGRAYWMGLFGHRKLLHLGQLDAAQAAPLMEALMLGHHLRVRIVGLTPEHLSTEAGPEVFISVWGNQTATLILAPAAAAP